MVVNYRIIKRGKVSSGVSLLSKVADEICELAKYYAPTSTGKLRDSIEVELYNNKWSIVSKDDKSLYIHENLGIRYEEPGRAKYLEDAANIIYNKYMGGFKIDIEYRPQLRVILSSYSNRI